MPKSIFDETYHLLGKSMNVAAKRHALIAGNIANLDTVGYTPKDIDFKKTLEMEMQKSQEKLSRTDPSHYSKGAGVPVVQTAVDEDGFESLDPVNIDTEMNKLVENNIKYRTSVEMLKKKMRIIKHAIAEGGR